MKPRRLRIHASDTDFVVRDALSGATLLASPDAATALQHAIDHAGPGEVVVEPGDYPLARPVRLASRQTLRGRGRGTRLLLAHDGPEAVALLGEQLDGSSVRDLALHGDPAAAAGTGVRLIGCGDCRLSDLFLLELPTHGVQLRDHCFLCEVRASQFAGCRVSALKLENLAKGRVSDYVTNTLADLSIQGGGIGVHCHFAVVLNIRGVSCFQTLGHAFLLEESSNSVLLTGCRTFQTTGSPLVARSSHELNISGNIFCWHTGDGIVLEGCRWGLVSANEVIDTGSHNPDVPDQSLRFDQLPAPPPALTPIVLRDVRGFNISANTLFNWPQGCRPARGIDEDAACADNTIAANNINYYAAAEPVRSLGARSLVAQNLGAPREPHISTADYPLIQSFQPARTATWIAAQR